MPHNVTPTPARALELARDLFPETLLVQQGDGGRLYTTSLLVAEYTGKRHRDVVRAIETRLPNFADEFQSRNFARLMGSIPVGKGGFKPVWMYEMTEAGFAMTMMGFNGKRASLWQEAFIEAFQTMRAALAAENDKWQAAFDRLHPRLRPVVRGTLAGGSRAIIAQPLGASVGSVTYHRRRARQLGLLH